ncbi:MAG: hypothetical protein HUJ61_06490, partial [Bacilli bacterium]|nr:hypothetical protein [Bacilli bacterium]
MSQQVTVDYQGISIQVQAQCDTAVHDLSLRKNHQRIPINKITLQSNNSNDLNDILINSSTNNNQFPSNNIPSLNRLTYQFASMEPNQDLAMKNNSIFSTKKSPILHNSNLIGINEGINDCKQLYTKDYVNELKLFHDKEKEQLLFKITTLENSINRIKSSFNDQINNIKFTQVTTEPECNYKINA